MYILIYIVHNIIITYVTIIYFIIEISFINNNSSISKVPDIDISPTLYNNNNIIIIYYYMFTYQALVFKRIVNTSEEKPKRP